VERPSIFGMIERDGGQVIRMLGNVKQNPIKPIMEITVGKGRLIYRDEIAKTDRRAMT
jgi:hypothetical protein